MKNEEEKLETRDGKAANQKEKNTKKKKQRKRHRRKKIFRRDVILNHLAAAGEVVAEKLLEAVWSFGSFASAMTKPYNDSYRALKRFPSQTPSFNIDFKSKIAFMALLSRLEREGLIVKNLKGAVEITAGGEEYLEMKRDMLPWCKRYKSAPGPRRKTVTLVVFDVPEKERSKRDWLRYQLGMMGFQKLQYSVWFGRGMLPKEFVQDLEYYRILPFVHIFSVSRRGTISHIFRRE